uniref:ARAD1B18348p n=1 Tax=Blastobotrys adeninivorans TaxID=409370 RepID=A0A060TBX7_BLAAD
MFTGLRRGAQVGLQKGCFRLPEQRANFIIPVKRQNVVKVYKSTPRLIPKGTSPLQEAEKRLLDKYDPTRWKSNLIDRKNPDCIKPGDIVRIRKEDGTTFVGMTLGIKRNNVSSTILLRNRIQGTAVESNFNIFNPQIIGIDILRRPIVPKTQSKLYYLRGNAKYDVGDLDMEMRKAERRRR